MHRRSSILAILLLGACARRSHPFVPPETMPGGWRLKDVKREPARSIATYEGAGSLQVEVDDMGSFEKAFDRAQRTRPETNMVFFNKGNYFAVVRWQQADRDAVRAFVKELENRLQ